MPERDEYPKRLFTENPFEGETPQDAYRRLQWGNDPESVFETSGPEDMIALGMLAQIRTSEGFFRAPRETYVAIGMETNMVYLIPKDGQGPAQISDRGVYLSEGPEVFQIDYVSRKGGEEAYYYHEHEHPYPLLLTDVEGTHQVLLPASHDEGRSYAVSTEGIIG